MNANLIYRGSAYQKAAQKQGNNDQALPGVYRGVAMMIPAEISAASVKRERSLVYRGIPYEQGAVRQPNGRGAVLRPAI